MANVTLTIGGRQFTVACADGEEAHVARLGRAIDAKASAAPGASGQGETRMLLFAALLLADDLHERDREAAPLPLDDADRLVTIAERLEALAIRLEMAAADD